MTLDVEDLAMKLSRTVAKNILPKVGKILRVKPSLSYLELHLVDHCNLNCKGCGHFSPIADEWFADPNEHARDMQQLRRLFSTIRVIRLLGGEPLLHPNIEPFLFSTRSCFPKADIRIVTNGILLDEMSDEFWEACRSGSIAIDITVYPPLEERETFFIKLAHAKGVKVRIQRTRSFYAFQNTKGNSANIGFQKCRSRMYCPNLREGKVYICPVPALVHYFNKRFGTRIPSAGFVDIYTPNLTGWDVKEVLGKGSSTCRYCTFGWDLIPSFPWSISKRTMKEWDAANPSTVGIS
jgi:hypothetical protein